MTSLGATLSTDSISQESGNVKYSLADNNEIKEAKKTDLKKLRTIYAIAKKLGISDLTDSEADRVIKQLRNQLIEEHKRGERKLFRTILITKPLNRITEMIWLTACLNL